MFSPNRAFPFIPCLALVATLSVSAADLERGPGEPRKGDEIVVCGKYFHTGTKVILWSDPGGFNAYEIDPKNAKPVLPSEKDSGKLRRPGHHPYNSRNDMPLGGWDVPQLQSHVDQFVLHYDVDGCARACFYKLEEVGLSVQFILDLDGTIYQTLDAKEKAWHATSSNDRSVGVEIGNIGAYQENEPNPFNLWYKKGADGKMTIHIPAKFGSEHTPNFHGHPVRTEPVTGTIQGKNLRQYDYTSQEYAALTKLAAALCTVFPKINCDYPRDPSGKLIPRKLDKPVLQGYEGVLGHYHIQTDKTDPGPALQWDHVIDGARHIMNLPLVNNINGQPVSSVPPLIQDE